MIEIASIATKGYAEVIEIRTAVRFYWNKDGSFDGIEFGPFQTELTEWEEVMSNKCLNAVRPSIEAE